MVADALSVSGRISVAMYDVTDLNHHHLGWRDLPDIHKLELVEHVEPVESHCSENVTCTDLFEWLADALNGATSAPPDPDAIAVGRSTTTPQSSDSSLNDEVERISITSFADEGTQVRFTSFVGEDEANVDVDAGETLSEAGAYAGSFFLNHSLFDTEYEKDSTKTMTVEVVLSFNAA